MVMKARKQTIVTGLEHLIGMTSIIESVYQGQPLTRLDGELWQIDCDQSLSTDDRIKVVGINGLRLSVEKI